MNFVIFYILISVFIIFQEIQYDIHKSKIHKGIESFGGKIVKIQRKRFSAGPFLPVGSLICVYRIQYYFRDELKEGWVKLGILSEPEWRL
ncbi:MAG TPA: hypothetical protein VF941_08265 [Clostridia bacterium]